MSASTPYPFYDLGTAFTAAAVAEDDDPPTMLGLGNRALQIPSVLFLQANGEFLVGEAAERRAGGDPSRVTREFKRRLGDHAAKVLSVLFSDIRGFTPLIESMTPASIAARALTSFKSSRG